MEASNTLSVVIPAWSGNKELAEMTYKLCQQVRLMCDELIVTEDGDEYSGEILGIVDRYLTHRRLGHGLNLAWGCHYASKDYIAMLDSDIQIESGNLRDLCIPNTLVYPKWANWAEYKYPQTGEELWQWFVVMPKEFVKQFPPFPGPGPEGLDKWGDQIKEQFPYIRSDKVTYKHDGSASYGVARIPS